jgi:HD-like signal output (HDOD) protein
MEKPRKSRRASVKEDWWNPKGVAYVEWVPPAQPELSHEARALENLLVSHFDGHDLSLPPLLNGAERVLPILADPDCTIVVLAEAIAADQVVAAAVLRMANSPLYRGVNKIAALQPAISRLGTRAIRMLLVHESLRAATFRRGEEGMELARIVWRRSLASACVMRGLAKFTSMEREEAFLTGLLHDVGNVVVLRIAHDDKSLKRGDEELDLDTFEYLCYETHQELGELVADAWSLPPTLKKVIAQHHSQLVADDPLRVTRLMIQVTDMVNSLLGYAMYAPYDLLNCRPVQELGLADRDDFVTFLRELPEFVEETVSSL